MECGQGARRSQGAHTSQLNNASRLADVYRTALSTDEQTSVPLIAFYPVERVVLDIPLKISEKHSFQQLDGYDNSLNQGVDFVDFSNGSGSVKMRKMKTVFPKTY